MFTPTTTSRCLDASRSASRRATTSAPSLLKPIRFTTARSAGSRNSRGRGLPGCGSPVTVPTSTNAKPSAASASMPSAFLSKPAASPSGPGKSSPITCSGADAARGQRPRHRGADLQGREAEPVGGLGVDAGQDVVEEQPVGAGHRRGPVLQRAHADLAGPHRLDALHGRGQPLHRGDARDVGHHRGGADLVAVDAGGPAAGRAVRRVHDQVDLAGLDQLHGGRLAVGTRDPRSACAPRTSGRRCAAAPRRCPGWRGSRSRGRRGS